MSSMKAFAGDKLTVTRNMKFVFHSVENSWKQEKMLVTSIFSISNNVFKWLYPQA